MSDLRQRGTKSLPRYEDGQFMKFINGAHGSCEQRTVYFSFRGFVLICFIHIFLSLMEV